jgi:hypothetical protein
LWIGQVAALKLGSMRLPSGLTPSQVSSPGNAGAPATPESLDFRLCKGIYLARLLLAVPLCAAGLFCIHQPGLKAQIAGWASLILFPLCFVLGLIQLLQTGPVITLSEEGILDRRYGIGVIPWSAIKSISERSFQYVRFLCVEVADQALLRKMPLHVRFFSLVNAGIGYGRITLNFTGLDGDIADALRFIRARFPQYLPNEMLPPSQRR